MSPNDLEDTSNPFGDDSTRAANTADYTLAVIAGNEKNSRRIGRAILFGSLILGLCVLLSTFSGRYTLIQQDAVLFRMDTWTGQISSISGNPLKGSPFGNLVNPERLFKDAKWIDLPR